MKVVGVVLVLAVSVLAGDLPLRGLDMGADQSLYADALESGSFKCKGSADVIPASQINDDYCDCADGSDEPGTSACLSSTFFCPNKGYKPSTLYSSRVNDGVCDCCDGSDEFSGATTCPNTCEQDGAEYRKHLRERYDMLKAGLKAKEALIHQAVAIRAEKLVKEKELRAQAEGLAKVVEEKTKAKDEAEEKEKAEREKKEEEWEAAEDARIAQVEAEIMAKEAEEEEEEETVKAELNIDGSSTIAGASATQAVDKGATEHADMNAGMEGMPAGKPEQEEEDDEEEVAAMDGKVFDMNDYPEGVDSMNDPPAAPTAAPEPCVMWRQTGGCKATGPRESNMDRSCKTLIADGNSGYCECAEGQRVEFACKHDPVVCEDACTDAIVGAAIGTTTSATNEVLNEADDHDDDDDDEDDSEPKEDPLVRKPMPAWSSEEANAAREALATAENDKSSVSRDLITTEKELQTEYGDDDVFLALFNKCATLERNKYKYEICLFGEAKQNDGAGSWLKLGSFDKWDDEVPNRMHFTGGQVCWNGPARSAYVDFTCGEEYQILTADEPEKCVYALEAKLPAVCTDLRTKAALAELNGM